MSHNVTYQNKTENIEYSDKVNLSPNSIRTFVYYSKSKDHGDYSITSGPILYSFNRNIVDNLSLNELLIYGFVLDLLLVDEVHISEAFDQRLTDDILRSTGDNASVSEIFNRDHRPALKEVITQYVEVLESYTSRHKSPVTVTPSQAMSVLEVFVSDLIQPDFVSLNDNINVSESFERRVSDALIKTTGDNITLEEAFAITLDLAIYESVISGLDISETFSWRLVETFTETRVDSISLQESFISSIIKTLSRSVADNITLTETFAYDLLSEFTSITLDTVVLSDVFDYIYEAFRQNRDVIELSDIFESRIISSINKFRNDNLNLSDSFSFIHAVVLSRSTSDVQSFSDIFSYEWIEGATNPPRFTDASQLDDGRVEVTWTDPVSGNPDTYIVQWNKNGGLWNVYTNSLQGTANSITHDGYITDYKDNDELQYRVAAVVDGSQSDWDFSNKIIISAQL